MCDGAYCFLCHCIPARDPEYRHRRWLHMHSAPRTLQASSAAAGQGRPRRAEWARPQKWSDGECLAAQPEKTLFIKAFIMFLMARFLFITSLKWELSCQKMGIIRMRATWETTNYWQCSLNNKKANNRTVNWGYNSNWKCLLCLSILYLLQK